MKGADIIVGNALNVPESSGREGGERNVRKSRTINSYSYPQQTQEHAQYGNNTSIAIAAAVNDPRDLPLVPAVLVVNDIENTRDEQLQLQTQKTSSNHCSNNEQESPKRKKKKKNSSRLMELFLFKPIHPQCNHISYACLILLCMVFSLVAVLLVILFPSDDTTATLHPSTSPSISVSSLTSVDDDERTSDDSISQTLSLSSNPTSKSSHVPSLSPSFNPTSKSSHLPSLSPSFDPTSKSSHVPSLSPSFNPTTPTTYFLEDNSLENYLTKELKPTDLEDGDEFGASCAISGHLMVVGASQHRNNVGAAYLFHLDGTLIQKLIAGSDGEEEDLFSKGDAVSIDRKIVVGTYNSNYIRIFSRGGQYERTIKCDECSTFGDDVATFENKIVLDGVQMDGQGRTYIYTTDGELLKSFSEGDEEPWHLAISEKTIISATGTKTYVYSNSAPDFPKITEIPVAATAVATRGDKLVIADRNDKDYNGAVYLYKTDGTFLRELDRKDSANESRFGDSLSMTDTKIVVGAPRDDNDGGVDKGAVYIYSAETGAFEEKIVASGISNDYDRFGSSVCSSGAYFGVGASADSSKSEGGGKAYVFPF